MDMESAPSIQAWGQRPIVSWPTENLTKPPVPRKKFAVPPVKVACLECRASRCRCDGNKPVCSNCANRDKKCVYVQSRRGGSRIRKRKVSSDANIPPARNQDLNQATHSILPKESQATFAGPLSFVTPGGGLKQLDLLPEDSEYIILNDSFTASDILDSIYGGSEDAGPVSSADTLRLVPIRTYGYNEAILGAYYTYIHQYFPVLPAPSVDQIYDDPGYGIRREDDALFSNPTIPGWEPDTPLSLALSATLALIPHPDDPDPTGDESVKLRREQARGLAQAAYSAIESESELAESNENPHEALSVQKEAAPRQAFHSQCPVRNESIIALLLLSTFEYAQRGNVTKMKIRAVQALNAAMDLGLHARGSNGGHFAEADRRTWWMTYVLACQSAILSNSETPMHLDDSRFTTPYPVFGTGPEGWRDFIVAQQAITKATQFVIRLDPVLASGVDASGLWQEMLQLDNFLEPLISRANIWHETAICQKLDAQEMVVNQSLLGMARIKLNSARIKLHRRNAFSDTPVFSKKHCDLKTRTDQPVSESDCGCSALFNDLQHSSHDMPLADIPQTLTNVITIPFPFDTKTSANIAYQCAFNIASSYAKLPFPSPAQSSIQQNSSRDTTAIINRPPRMIPIFSCCAMQSSYVFIMLYHRFMIVASRRDDGTKIKLLNQLTLGMNHILDALKNYSIAYEAIGGMPEQIEDTIRRMGFGRM